MKEFSKFARYKVCSLAIAALLPSMAFAQTVHTGIANITGYFTGWYSDAVRVTLAGGTYNEGGCSVQDGYMVTKTATNGYDTHVSALLAAFMSGKKFSWRYPVVHWIDRKSSAWPLSPEGLA